MNTELRHHVTRVGFDLTLTSRQLEAIVWFDEALRRHGDEPNSGNLARTDWSYPEVWVPAMGGLMRKGLTWHITSDDGWRHKDGTSKLMRECKGLTRAGELMLGLLREAGLYQETHARLFPDGMMTRDSLGRRRLRSVA